MVLANDDTKSSSSEDEGGDTNDAQNKYLHSNFNRYKTSQSERNANKPGQKSNTKDNPEVLLKVLIDVSKKLGQRIKRTFYFVLNDMEGNQIIDHFAQWCVQHPKMAICLLAAGLVTSLPILLFTAFTLSTIVMTFTGFLVLEGTLLTIITMIMLGLLGALGMVLLFFALVGFTTYFGVSHVYDMYNSTETERTNLRNAMKTNDRNLNSEPLAKTNLSMQERNLN